LYGATAFTPIDGDFEQVGLANEHRYEDQEKLAEAVIYQKATTQTLVRRVEKRNSELDNAMNADCAKAKKLKANWYTANHTPPTWPWKN